MTQNENNQQGKNSTQDNNNSKDGNNRESGNRVTGKQVGDNTVKDPDNWTTGAEPMTGAQNSYLNTLASEAGVSVEDDLTKAEASKKIDELQHKTGRGVTDGDDQ